MSYSIIFTEKPVPVNSNNSSRKISYQKSLKTLMENKYKGATRDAKYFYNQGRTLYVLLSHFYKRKLDVDIDNILKYTIDSFEKLLYKNDRQIKYCISQAIQLEENTMSILDLSLMDEDCIGALFDFLKETNHEAVITYFECGIMDNKFYKFNLDRL